MNDFHLMQAELEKAGLQDLLLWSYVIAGGLFIIYCFITFIQTYIPVAFRAALSIIFFTIGTLFLSLAARIVTGYYQHFTIISVVLIVVLSIFGGVFVVNIFKKNKRGRHIYKNLKNQKK